MTDIILGIGVATFIVYTGFHISYILSLRRTSERMGDFLQKTEGNLNAPFRAQGHARKPEKDHR